MKKLIKMIFLNLSYDIVNIFKKERREKTCRLENVEENTMKRKPLAFSSIESKLNKSLRGNN